MSCGYLFWREEGRVLEAAVSESESMVMEVVSAAVSGSEVAGNWMRMVYTASPWQSGDKGGLGGNDH